MEDNFHKKLSSLNEISKTQLMKLFTCDPEPIDLTMEPSIMKPLERICGVKWLKEAGVRKMYKLGSSSVKLETYKRQFYIIYANVDVFKTIVNSIYSTIGFEKRPTNKFHIICVPKSLYIFEQILEEMGLYETIVKLYSLQWQPIHIDRGLLSLEIPHMYKHLFVHQDLSLLQMYAKSLWSLSFVTGKPKLVVALGKLANGVVKQLDELYNYSGDTDKLNCDFGGLIVMDRNIDYASALLTPSTYTALLKEIYDVKCGTYEYKHDDAVDCKHDTKFNVIYNKNPIGITLDSKSDSVYNSIKNRYFTDVTSVLSALTKQLRDEGETSKEMALDEIKKYVQTQLQAVTSKKKFVAIHLNAAETIIGVMGHRFEKQQQIEQNILQNTSKSNNYSYLNETLFENDKLISLRLMCLMCVSQKLSESEVKSFLTKYYHEFGFKYGYLYSNLEKAGFIKRELGMAESQWYRMSPNARDDFYVNANKLKLIPSEPDKIDVNMPTCPSYIFGGCYIPLITQIASLLLSATPLKEIEEKLKPLGPVVIRNSDYPLTTRSILIYVIGGVTYAEVAACNLLEVLTGSKITMISDQYISGNDIVEGLLASPAP